MPDLDTALDQLGRFADHPPMPRLPTEEVAARAAARRRRRQRFQAGAMAAAIALVVGASVTSLGERDVAEVRTAEDPQTFTPSSVPSPPTTAPSELVVTPDTDLVDGQVVTVTGPFDPGAVLGVAICGSEVWDAGGDVLPWCSTQGAQNGAGGVRVAVQRVISTERGPIDCAERAERCLIGVRTTMGNDVVGPISFRSGLEPTPDSGNTPDQPEITLDRTTVADGQTVTVTGSGFVPGAGVAISQCHGTAPTEPGDVDGTGCDLHRALLVRADDAGRFEVPFIAYREVLLDSWQPCEPCFLGFGIGPTVATQPISVEETDTAIRPQVLVSPPGPHAPGTRVTLTGSGFQQGADLSIGWCSFTTEDPTTETEGNPQVGGATCSYPDEGFGAMVDDHGGFIIDRYPLPDGRSEFPQCLDPAVRCGLADHSYEGSLPVFVTPFELRQ